MTAYLSPIGNDQFIDANGNPLTGGKVYTYLAGTSTPAGTWTTSAGDVAQANPIILNSLGATTNPVWLTANKAYKFVIKDASDVTTLYTFDNITGINDPSYAQPVTPEWTQSSMVLAYTSPSTFSVTGDVTTQLPIGIRIKTANTAGLVYSTVSNSVHSSGFTTVTVINDTGSALDSGLSSLSYSILSPTKPSLPNSQAARDAMGIPYAIGRNLLLNSSMLVNQDNRTLGASNITLAAGEYLIDGWRAGSGGAIVNFSGVYFANDPRVMTIVSGSMQCPFEWYRLQSFSYPCVLAWVGTSLGGIYDTNAIGGNTPSQTSPFRSNFSSAPAGNSYWAEFGVGTVKIPQLELGNTPTSYEYKTPRQDIAECQRYANRICCSIRATSAGAGAIYECTVSWPEMRATPTIGTGAVGTFLNASAATLTISASSKSSGRFAVTAVAAGDCFARDYIYPIYARL